MRNRTLLQIITFLVAVAYHLVDAQPVISQSERPNIVYILLDDAGYGDLSCYGQRHFETPNIDQLAQEGMRFTQHYSGSTVCAPTRCCLMTGVHTGHSYVRGNREVQPEGQSPLPADIVTLPRLLRQAGYVTGAFGKWGLGAPSSPSDPAEHFDLFFGYNCQRQAHTYYPKHLWRNYEKITLDGQTHSADVIMKEALDFIRDNQSKPFFAFLPVTIPHAAMHATEEYIAPFREKFPQFANKVGKYAKTETKNPIAAFAGMMTQVDAHVGQVVSLLQELGLEEKTLVMLSSDNGPHQEGGHDPQFFDSNGPLKGHKRDLYEGGVRVPLIARWPGKVPAGTESDHISAHWDMLPTFCELSGAEIPPNVDGISMVNQLMGNVEQQATHDYLYWEFYERGGKRAARFGDWKAVQLNVNKDLDAPIEIYDLAQDLGEENNIAAKHPDQVERAKAIFCQGSFSLGILVFREIGQPTLNFQTAPQKLLNDTTGDDGRVDVLPWSVIPMRVSRAGGISLQFVSVGGEILPSIRLRLNDKVLAAAARHTSATANDRIHIKS